MQIHWSIFIPYIIKWKLNNLPFPMNKGNSYSCGLCACGECYLPIYSILTTASWGRWWCFHFIDEKIRLWEVKDIASMAELECQLAHLSPKYTHTHTHSHTLPATTCWYKSCRSAMCFFLISRSIPTKVDLRSGLEECAVALNLFLSNKFTDALELLQPW